MNITWSPTPNSSVGRNGKTILAIVDHITAGNYPGCLSWMQNPTAQASAHYLVTKAGEVFQLVAEANTAWHAGIVNHPSWSLYDGSNPNRYTIGIEHECLSGGELTEPQYQATLQLHRELTAKYNIPLDADHIIGHYRIDSVNRPNCPGPNFPWARLFADLQGVQIAPVIARPAQTSIIYKGQQLAVPVDVSDGKSRVYVRALFEAMGLTVAWDNDKNAVIIE